MSKILWIFQLNKNSICWLFFFVCVDGNPLGTDEMKAKVCNNIKHMIFVIVTHVSSLCIGGKLGEAKTFLHLVGGRKLRKCIAPSLARFVHRSSKLNETYFDTYAKVTTTKTHIFSCLSLNIYRLKTHFPRGKFPSDTLPVFTRYLL